MRRCSSRPCFAAHAVLVLAVAVSARAVGGEGSWIPFVLPWDDATPSPTDVSFLLDPPAGGAGFIVARDGHFFQGERRVRFLGVNLCFGACFPAAEEAVAIAARMAKFGINCVRFHHMDSAPFLRGIFRDRKLEELSPEALERLDRLIFELKKKGIYTNLNLHVSRWWSRAHGWPEADELESYDKMIDIVHPELIEAQKRYARDLLTHRNPHTGTRYVEEPAVCMVEITNEDSLFMWSAPQMLPNLPEPYARVFAEKWTEWLRARYRTDEALRAAWAKGESPIGATMLRDPGFETLAAGGGAASGEAKRVWTSEQHEGAALRVSRVKDAGDAPAARIEIDKITGVDWHLKFGQRDVAFKRGAFYTVTFRARADRAKRIRVGVTQNHEPWQSLGLSSEANLSAEWRPFRFGFEATAAEENARLEFTLGSDTTAVELAGIELAPGGRVGLGEGEELARGTVALYPAIASITEARADDRLRFYHDLERAYFTGMRDFLTKDLGLRALVTGTIAFGALGTRVQAEMDFVDQHAYWQHPHFPRRPWDSRDWIVNNRAMSADPRGGTLPGLAATRVAGKPYTVTEYNHPAPMDSQAETVPILAAFAAIQDWDGIFLFTYSHASDFRREKYNGFFDIDANPAKMGFMPAAALMFLGECVRPAANATVEGISFEEAIAASRRSLTHLVPYLEARGSSLGDLLLRRWALSFDGAKVPPSSPEHIERLWGNGLGGGFLVGAARAAVLCGFRPGSALGSFALETIDPPGATIVLVSRDREPLRTSREILLIACGRCENTGMGWNETRDSVADRWGTEPVRIEAVTAELTLFGKGKVAVHALDERGSPRAEIPVVHKTIGATFTIGSTSPSLWYLIRRSD